MILLDTNVVSEPMRKAPDRAVLKWLDGQVAGDLYLCAITVAEIRFGMEILPSGKRRQALKEGFAAMLRQEFAGRVWPFDEDAATHFGKIAASRKAAGRPISIQDCQIAAVARSRGAAVATRNVRDFEGCGIDLLNPWVDAD